MEKLLASADLPPSYINLGYDTNPTEGPSAPRIHEDGSSADDYSAKIIEPPSPPPKYDPKLVSFGPVPTAPSTDSPMLQCTPPSLVFEDIYDACVRYVENHCCYSSRFVNRMKLTDINNGCAFHYSLESYGEKRETAYHYIPYKGGPIDGPENGRAPDPWQMSVPIISPFLNKQVQITIPHTDFVETCSKCSGSGKVTCNWCSGSGSRSCSSCSSGRDSDGNTCSSCSGSGRTRCSSCSGSGKETCSKCSGYGKVKNYKVLIVTWTNHRADFVSNIGQLPAKKLRICQGDLIFSEEKDQVFPINNCPDDTVNAASAHLMEAHKNSFRNEVFRRQRQNLRVFPFTVAKYKYKEDEGEFYIYDKDRKVYFEDYPTDCCCCICC